MASPPVPVDYAARTLALLISSQSINSVIWTRKAATSFLGVPVSEEAATFFPALGGRNGAIGLAVLILSLSGDRRAAGVIYCCCSLKIGFADLYTCYRSGGKWKVHAVGAAVLGAMGTALLRAS